MLSERQNSEILQLIPGGDCGRIYQTQPFRTLAAMFFKARVCDTALFLSAVSLKQCTMSHSVEMIY